MKKYKIISACICLIMLLAGCNTAVPTADKVTENTEQSAKTQNLKVEVNLNEDEQAILNPYDFPVGEQPYFIYCEKKSHTLTIFKKNEAGYYADIVAQYLTATGKGMSMTPTGVFKIMEKRNGLDGLRVIIRHMRVNIILIRITADCLFTVLYITGKISADLVCQPFTQSEKIPLRAV